MQVKSWKNSILLQYHKIVMYIFVYACAFMHTYTHKSIFLGDCDPVSNNERLSNTWHSYRASESNELHPGCKKYLSYSWRCQVQINEDYNIWLVGYKRYPPNYRIQIRKTNETAISLNQLCSCNSVLQPSSDKQNYAKLLDVKYLIKTIEANV